MSALGDIMLRPGLVLACPALLFGLLRVGLEVSNLVQKRFTSAIAPVGIFFGFFALLASTAEFFRGEQSRAGFLLVALIFAFTWLPVAYYQLVPASFTSLRYRSGNPN
jgi:hypothetical protein